MVTMVIVASNRLLSHFCGFVDASNVDVHPPLSSHKGSGSHIKGAKEKAFEVSQRAKMMCKKCKQYCDIILFALAGCVQVVIPFVLSFILSCWGSFYCNCIFPYILQSQTPLTLSPPFVSALPILLSILWMLVFAFQLACYTILLCPSRILAQLGCHCRYVMWCVNVR